MLRKIFISYRRDDDPGNAGRLFDQLKQSFGSDQLFFDVNNIEPGLNFLTVINEEMAQSAVLLVVIGRQWIDALNRRNAQPNAVDYVRIEIELALEQGKRIIPVLVHGALMPQEGQLPVSIRLLAFQQSSRITHDRFGSDVESLIQTLRRILDKSSRTSPSEGLESGPEVESNHKGVQQLGAKLERVQAYSRVAPTHPGPPSSPELDPLSLDMRNYGTDSDAPFHYDDSAEMLERYFSPSFQPRPRGLSKGAIAIGVTLILVGASILWGQPAMKLVSGLFESSRIYADRFTPKPTIPDRVGQLSSSEQVAPTVQRAVLSDEDPSDPKGKQYVGSVIWRTEQIKASGNQKPDVAVRADIEIPDRKFKMTLSFRRNADSSLPASHTAELTFILPKDFVGEGIGNVPGILMKSNEQARGIQLAGLAVKIMENFFLIGLSNVDADRAYNLQLLKGRTWLELPLVYANQRRSTLTIAKGAPGERAFNDAFVAWGQ